MCVCESVREGWGVFSFNIYWHRERVLVHPCGWRGHPSPHPRRRWGTRLQSLGPDHSHCAHRWPNMAGSAGEGPSGTRIAPRASSGAQNGRGGGKGSWGWVGSGPRVPFLPWVKGCPGASGLSHGGGSSPLVFGCCGRGRQGGQRRRLSGFSACEICQGLINLI